MRCHLKISRATAISNDCLAERSLGGHGSDPNRLLSDNSVTTLPVGKRPMPFIRTNVIAARKVPIVHLQAGEGRNGGAGNWVRAALHPSSPYDAGAQGTHVLLTFA